MPIIPIGSGKSEYGNGTNATIKTLLLQNVIVHPLPVQLIYCIFITLQTKGKTLVPIAAATFPMTILH